ncbi:MAG: hypothetical protein CVT82_01685 [Alphaproteobacteria bacterium HGW-Alphaproteobacteria-4]|nr:MAG: hypothetical protein CVT82_01685 [Alphaproteobacteria bacterium HGW-Alphaproteobacteria-4]
MPLQGPDGAPATKHKTASRRMRTFLEAAKQVRFARGTGRQRCVAAFVFAGQVQTDAAGSRAKGARE